MPHYLFHARIGSQLVADDVGVTFPDEAAASRFAERMLRKLNEANERQDSWEVIVEVDVAEETDLAFRNVDSDHGSEIGGSCLLNAGACLPDAAHVELVLLD